jgi:sodium/hydrogen antiporter
MGFLAWMAFVGGLLLLMALSSAYLRRLPITTSAIYLFVGLAISPAWLGLVSIDPVEWREWAEHLTEIAVIVSLFIGGLKLRLPFNDPAWSAAYRLAFPVMMVSIAGVAAFAHYVLGLPWPSAFLLGAILAPTDPVLASTVSVSHSADHDRMRYGLSGEAGFNDGMAFPFVVFALSWMEFDRLGSWIGGWALHRVVWAVPAGLLIGYGLGFGIGRFAIWLRSKHQDQSAPNDFLALALIALAYVAAEISGAWGFLAAFGAGLGFRHAEIKVVRENPDPEANASRDPAEHPIEHPPAESLVGHSINSEDLKHPAKAAGLVVTEIISFGDTAERMIEVAMIVVVGVCLALYWDARGLALAAALFLIIRPAAVALFLLRTETDKLHRSMMAWFGIRGIGSLYYLSYAMTHGLEDNVTDLVALTISVVAVSIVAHGISSEPILRYYDQAISAEK